MIPMSEYAQRRKSLLQVVGDDSIIIIPSGREIIRNGDANYAFRQRSDFYYLTGFDEPDAVLVLSPKGENGKFILFTRARHREREIWDGPRAGIDGARHTYLADAAFTIDTFREKLPDLIAGHSAVHYPFGMDTAFDQLINEAVNDVRRKIRRGLQSPTALIDIEPTVHEMRLIKSPAEIDTIKHAIAITREGHLRAMRRAKPGLYEYELEAELMYSFYAGGARACAYTSIVGSGANTCILHYIANNKKIAAGDLVLIDAGCEYQNYASDITRTFPASGKYSREQRMIYEIVLNTQRAIIQQIKPGVYWDELQKTAVKVITQGLINVGVLKGDLNTLIDKQAYLAFYMHNFGHYMGLDVHDVGRYKVGERWRQLQPGMVFTVEPGIYIAADNAEAPPQFHNIGIRIEDDVLVTDNGCEVLSESIPKTIDEIETIMADGANQKHK